MVSVALKPGAFFTVPDNIHRAVKDPYELAVLIHLLQRRDDDGRSYPCQETLAQGIMSRKQVQRSTGALENRGLISIERRWLKGGGIQLVYTVNLQTVFDAVHATHSPLDSQSTGLTVHTQETDSPLVQATDSPPNHIHTLTIPSLTKPITSSGEKENFEDFRKRLAKEERYAEIDHRLEYERCQEWCEERRKKMSKKRWRNWLEKAIEIRLQKEKDRNNDHNGNGHKRVQVYRDATSYGNRKTTDDGLKEKWGIPGQRPAGAFDDVVSEYQVDIEKFKSLRHDAQGE